MERPYPYRPVNLPIERLSLYFDTDEVPAFHAVNAALAQSIVLWSPNLHLHGNILGIQFLLANTYGGSTLLYPISPWECGSFIIKLPNYLNRDQVLAEFLPWCVDRNILLTPWDPNLYLCRQPTFGYRLDIIVNGFPVPLWHEYFIIRFLSALGNVVYVNGDNLLGRDKSRISAVIYCLDPRAVPRLVAVHFLNFWADVKVHVREWDDYPHIPLRLRPFPDFADPNDPFGDDPTEADMSSPVRAHLVSCHDSMRALFIPDEEQPQIPLPQPQVVTNRAYCTILTKGLIKVGQFNLFPEYTALGVQLCVAALILSIHRRNTQSRRGNPQASVWPCMPSLPPKPPRGSMRFKYSITPKSQPSKYKTQFLSPLSYQTEALHVLHVEEPPEHTSTQRFANLQGKSGESNLGLSYANIPFVCLTPSCQVDPSTCMCATTVKEFFINAHSDCQTKMTPVPPKKSCQLEPDLYSGKQHLKPECNKNPNCMQKTPSPPCAYKNPTTPTLPSPQTPPCSILGPYPTLQNSGNTLSKMNSSDEISTLFSSIAPDSASSSRRITIPHQITASRDWSLSCLARVMTDRTVFDDNFTNMMMRDWEANPRTRISPIAKNTYLVDFATSKEMYEVLEKEPWFYRTDVVSMRKVHEPSQLKSDFVEHVSLWTQFHNVPPEMLSAEGIYYLAGLIGTPVSEVRQGYNAGRLFMRVKTSYSVLKGLQDSIPLDHPTLGPISIFLVYERASRLCIFCGGIGHVISGCAQRSRVLQLCADPINANRPELVLLRDYPNWYCYARLTWFISLLGLRTSHIMQSQPSALLHELWKDLSEEQLAYFMMLAWNVWKARCDATFKGNRCVPEKTLALVRPIKIGSPIQLHLNIDRQDLAEEGLHTGYKVWVDGSYDPTNVGGAAYLMELDRELVRYETNCFQRAISPFHMEVTALLMAVKQAALMQVGECQFFTDSKILVDSLDPARKMLPLQAADWRSYTQLLQIALILKTYPLYRCTHVKREENVKAHLLANWARREQAHYGGFTFPTFSQLQ